MIGPEGILGIVGHPVAHSLSPALHNWALAGNGLPKAYFRWDIRPERLVDFVAAVRTLGIKGVSVTIPHKVEMMDLVDEVTDEARAVGAVNTLFWKDDALVGGNTDVFGFLAPLKLGGRMPTSALVLGVGGAARAVVFGLRREGAEVLVAGRDRRRAEKFARMTGTRAVDWQERGQVQAQLLVNATPLGMSGAQEAMSPWPCGLVGFEAVYDLVYNPVQTVLLNQARAEGRVVFSGLDMFVHQAQAQFRLWTGREFGEDQARVFLHGLLARMTRP
ncbi:MAG: shikimate dehydrogenase [Deltaproteobacteria bacterium]|nr:shikimate dehydrogenase [Deltaproteobacteria bacterium]